MQAALTGGTRGLSAKKRDRGADAGSSEGAARDAAISVALAGESGGGGHTGGAGGEPRADLARRYPVGPRRRSHQAGTPAGAPNATMYESTGTASGKNLVERGE